MKTTSLTQQIARRAILGTILAVILVMALTAVASGVSAAAPVAVEKSLTVGGSEVLDFQGIKRAAVTDPNVADYQVLSSKQLMLVAKTPGATDFYVWDDQGQHSYRVVVAAPAARMAETVRKIAEAINQPGIRVSEFNGVIVLDGVVDTARDAQRAETIAATYVAKEKVRNVITVLAPQQQKLNLIEIQKAIGPDITVRALSDTTLLFEGKASAEERARMDVITRGLGRQVTVVDMVSAPGYAPRQIVVRTKVADINRSAVRDIGVEWGGLTKSDEGVYTAHDQPILFGEVFSGQQPDVAADSGGPLRRLDGISAQLKALETQNKARVLAEPNLLVREGQSARLLVGGEIPIPVVQTGSGASSGAVSVEWKEFGVRLDIAGTVSADGKSIDLDITPEVSSLDYGNAIVTSGFTIPALRTRRAHSVLHVENGQTLVIGGLYQSDLSKVIRKIPLLGDLPILGEFFKHTVNNKTETELVIFVTPEIMTQESAAARTTAAQATTGETK